ncbi:monofunctional biosynthetic peptidoglycan transglycosylase [soil metagenome]
MLGVPKLGRRSRPILIVLLILAMLPIGGVLVHAILPPPLTFLMARQALAGQGMDYRWRGLGDISPNLVYAAIGAEDARYCSHDGFDFEAIQKALDHNQDGSRVRGGSTISQQTAKNVFLWPSRDWVRKGLEAGYTVLIEAIWGKRRIMEVYLNVAEWAPGVYGAEAAAHHWFGVDARDLSPSQAARLAAILPSPRRYDAAEPGPFVRRRAAQVERAARMVRSDGLARCVIR